MDFIRCTKSRRLGYNRLVNEKYGFDKYIKRIMDEDQEILESLGSDFDEEGIPYWEKWGKNGRAANT